MDVTIRDTIDGLMATPSEQETFKNDRSAFLDEHDLSEVPEELIDTAFVHYADTTSIENADALAPLVTRVGPVPMEETDLPDGVTDELGDGDPPDPWSMLTFDSATEPLDDAAELDPADLDDTSAPEAIAQTTADSDGPDFGAGEASIADGFADDDTGDDPFFDDNDDDFGAAAAVQETVELPDDFDTSYDQDVESFVDSMTEGMGEDLAEEVDPGDLDFGE